MRSCDKCGAGVHIDDAMNQRCNDCEHLVRQCICSKTGEWDGVSVYPVSYESMDKAIRGETGIR